MKNCIVTTESGKFDFIRRKCLMLAWKLSNPGFKFQSKLPCCLTQHNFASNSHKTAFLPVLLEPRKPPNKKACNVHNGIGLPVKSYICMAQQRRYLTWGIEKWNYRFLKNRLSAESTNWYMINIDINFQ